MINRAKPWWAVTILTLVIWSKVDCAEKLGRQRAMITPDGPRPPSLGLMRTLRNCTVTF